MNLKEVMQQKNFAVLGDTVNPKKFACTIKNKMLDAGYNIYPVGKELSSLNDIDGEIDIIDLCINPVRGLELLKENKKSFKGIVVQPGAESPELLEWLEQQKIPYLQGCLLVGLASYRSGEKIR